MAFGINRQELLAWKQAVRRGEIAFLTHYWIDERFPEAKTVTKVGCSDIEKLTKWGEQYGLRQEWIHMRSNYPHFDLIGDRAREILQSEQIIEQIERFRI